MQLPELVPLRVEIGIGRGLMKKSQMRRVGQKLERVSLSCFQVMTHAELLLYPRDSD